MYGGKNKRDANEAVLVKLARQLGAEWFEGPPLDGWICHAKTGFVPVEIKKPQRAGQKYEFTRTQREFFAICDEKGLPYWIWRTDADVMRCLGARIAS